LDSKTVPVSLCAEVFAARLGDVRLIGLPFETYSDIALQIKRALRPAPTLFAGYANGLYGYCPTRWAKDAGGYGPSSAARWFGALLTAIGYGADEVLVKAAINTYSPIG
jgi:hypothetical protein